MNATFYDITMGRRSSFAYASRAQVRAAMLRHLRRLECCPELSTGRKRIRLADLALADAHFLGKLRGSVVSAVARDVTRAALDGRWDDPTNEAADALTEI